jgi:hypothetical protein
MILIFLTWKQKLRSQFFDLGIENPLGGGTLAKIESSLLGQFGSQRHPLMPLVLSEFLQQGRKSFFFFGMGPQLTVSLEATRFSSDMWYCPGSLWRV